jgi:tetratricopeptide (TPR) repeat protein
LPADRNGCIDAETLAAFMDGTCLPSERTRIERHLVGCRACYDIFIEAAQTQADIENVLPYGRTAPSRSLWWMAAGAAAAAVLAATWLGVRALPGARAQQHLRALVSATGPSRFAQARLAEPLPWAPPPSVLRGAATRVPPPPTIETLGSAIDELARTHPSRETLHASGLALLARQRVDEAVATLLAASATAPDDEIIRVDLAAALLEQNTSDSIARARVLVEQTLAREPNNLPATFDLALLLERIDRDRAAAAWRRYLEVDPTGSWAEEAKAHLSALAGG